MVRCSIDTFVVKLVSLENDLAKDWTKESSYNIRICAEDLQTKKQQT